MAVDVGTARGYLDLDIGELRKLAVPAEVCRSLLAVAVLCDNALADVRVRVVFFVVGIAVKEQNNIRVLLDRTRIT